MWCAVVRRGETAGRAFFFVEAKYRKPQASPCTGFRPEIFVVQITVVGRPLQGPDFWSPYTGPYAELPAIARSGYIPYTRYTRVPDGRCGSSVCSHAIPTPLEPCSFLSFTCVNGLQYCARCSLEKRRRTTALNSDTEKNWFVADRISDRVESRVQGKNNYGTAMTLYVWLRKSQTIVTGGPVFIGANARARTPREHPGGRTCRRIHAMGGALATGPRVFVG